MDTSLKQTGQESRPRGRGWRAVFGSSKQTPGRSTSTMSTDFEEEPKSRPGKWSLGVLNDKSTDEVPGSVLLMSKETKHNEPLGLRNMPTRTSASSLPSTPTSGQARTRPSLSRRESTKREDKKKTANGQIILEPQPDDSMNDPLNWPSWRRDVALLSLGFYCMMGGGMTPVLAAGYQNVSNSYAVPLSKVALTTGFYMLGLGVGSVVNSPTAILYGKRPVYLCNILLFALTAVWCAVSPNYISLVIARVFMGLAVSPTECLPSATIAEIFFLHERAYRLGIYTLLLLGGKNIVPLVSAVIIQGLRWQWVFWIVAIIVGFCFGLIFLFVPETFWDRTPIPKVYSKGKRPTLASLSALFHHHSHIEKSSRSLNAPTDPTLTSKHLLENPAAASWPNVTVGSIAQRRTQKNSPHVGFVEDGVPQPVPTIGLEAPDADIQVKSPDSVYTGSAAHLQSSGHLNVPVNAVVTNKSAPRPLAFHSDSWRVEPRGEGPKTPGLHNLNSPYYLTTDAPRIAFEPKEQDPEAAKSVLAEVGSIVEEPNAVDLNEKSPAVGSLRPLQYTHHLRTQPAKTFVQNLRPWNGRLSNDSWFKVAVRPFILFAYPSILWSTLVYSLSIGWLIVLSETVSVVYRNPDSYNFSALGTGLVYISPFIGGILGTAVAGKLSDIIVRFMSKRNGGVYEPEFRLVMAIPVVVATVIGLMGFGWSAAEKDSWIVPTIFFGIISFGCSLGSTTAITFAVDSYRQYAGEALVTLNFSKNIFHGLAFSLFFPNWLEAEGSKQVFIIIGVIQLVCLSTTVPMYMFGKRARMWTVRRNLMERF